MDDDDPMDEPRMPRQCTAKSKRSGERCKNAPARGSNVCRFHGGAAPQTREAARRRLLEAAEPAAIALRQALDSRDINAVIRAAIAVLDRCGFHPRQRINVEDERPQPRVILTLPDNGRSGDSPRRARLLQGGDLDDIGVL